MKLGRSLLLGTAAGLAVSAGAQAADLPVRKAAPVDYVRVCDWTGVGYFYIPGTDTCIQIGGYVRVEGAFTNQARTFLQTPSAPTLVNGQVRGTSNGFTNIGRAEDTSGFFTRGRIQLDTRTQTAYGTLRAFVRYQIDRYGGEMYQQGGQFGGYGVNNGLGSQTGNNAFIDKAYIQFAGITAGHIQSFFDFYADNYNYEAIANSDQSVNVFAYTYSGPGGFSATLSVEDHNARNDGIGNTVSGVGAAAVTTIAGYDGSTIPDIVGQLNLTQAWGQAQLSAAYHQVNTASGSNVVNTSASVTPLGAFGKDADGFAVQGGVQLKLPMLAAGDDLWIEGAYQNGAYLYEDANAFMNAGEYGNGRSLGGFVHLDRDAIAIAVPGGSGAYTLAESRGFSVMAAFNHYFTATFHDVLFGSYEETSYGRAKNIDWTQGGLGDASKYVVGNQFLWDPVKNFEIGLEFDYLHIDQTLAHAPGTVATALPVGITKNPDAFETRLRLERDF